ncbi:type I 3-dehydroquinate dehydratase [Lactococcus insecticola]|uniref:3-dehydroquinate dehydratase n=1 Tax=Pseudolactococcus insecticola TaxID=2709158 RepID=A0A6A0B5J4_9LACT|nr:type I 3-dehydroquinate dehydratase [Lactococcus insecticola]GFH39963.1 3-dehydroquinate dehydratase [Lactococcus insecticola]
MKIVVPIMPKTLAELATIDERKFTAVDMIEWRADFMTFSELEQAARDVKIKFSKHEIIFTYRTEDKVETQISATDYAALIERFAADFDYIDVEKFTFPDVVLPENAIFSYHDFDQIPERLPDILSDMIAENPAVVKFAGMPRDFADVLRLMQDTLAASEKAPHQTFVTMAMGKIGQVTRLMGDEFGSSWTFATVEAASAPGQLSVADILTLTKILEN